jgi:hypothetical protein
MRTPGVSPGAYFPARPLRSRSADVILWTGESKVHHRRYTGFDLKQGYVSCRAKRDHEFS